MPPKTNQQVIDESKIAAQNVLNISGVSGGAYSPQAITSEQLKPSSPLVIPPTPQNTNNDLGIIAGIAGNLATLTGQQTAQEQAQKTSQNDITSLMEQLSGKTADTQTANEVSGLNASTKQLNDLNAQAQSLYRESQAIPIQIQQQFEGQGATAGGVAPLQTSALRNNALKALSIAQQTDIAQANYTSAKDKAQQIVDLKYKPLEDQLAIKQQIYTFNKDALERIDKKRADALNVAIEQEKQAIADKKTEEKGIQDIKLTMASYGADVSKLDGAKTIDEALEMAGTSLQDPMLNINIETAKTNLAKIKQDMYYSKLKSEAELHPSSVITEGVTGDISSLLATNKIGQTTKTQIGTILGVLNAAEEMATASEGGNFPGISPANVIVDFIPFRNALRQEKGTENIGYINGINLKIQQWASGAALTEQQTKQVENMTPNKNDTDKNVAIKLNNLSNFMQLQIKGTLQSEGIQYTPEKIDLFNKKQTLEDIFK